MAGSAVARSTAVQSVNTDSKTAPPKTILHMAKMEMYALELGDENGMRQKITAFRVNGTWYHDPNGSDWLNKLRVIKPGQWLSEQAEERFRAETEPPAVPKADTVDVLGGGE